MRAKDLREWMNTVPPIGLGIERIVTRGAPKLPTDYPGVYHAITGIGGPGFTTEMVFDVVGFQLRTVGPQIVGAMDDFSYDEAEKFAWDLDKRLLTFPIPTQIGEKRCINIQRIGSEPSYLETDSADRTHFVCSYLFEIQSGY